MFKFIDPFLVSLLSTVLLASLFPCYGRGVVFFDNLAIIAIALMFFLQGARLSRQAMVEGLLHWRLHLVIFICTFVLFPILGIGLHFFFPHLLIPGLWSGVIFLCCLPSTVQSSIAFTSIAKGNVPAAICSATASNLLGVFITPLLAGLIFSSQGHLKLDGTINIVYQLLLPFIAGQLLQPWIGEWAVRNRRLLSFSDRGSILIVVYSAFSEAVNMHLWQKLSIDQLIYVVLIDVFLLFLVLTITAIVSKFLKFSLEDRISVIFCGSKKTLASGVPIANVLFPSSMVGIIVLPLMIFHQIQLFIIAILAKYCAKLMDKELAAKKED
ncbi:Predicted Na+-dependent transporter YfeH (YfeH) (PDB:4N7X) (PUBMED:21175741) [Commensalibacter communis]|uniref:bile acid:sodium symporter family protein n=1 Tax=Commensalibacter communis TaxID=2972786 RepID=UPI0022FFBCDC|nr:bile acid:sodium symporter family protein [Commensalibacter communis]CAI3929523.1 Predicted Na+-dependent transporter YfeH (YfeH) (PDB:4N7X) (PUBMED:21175741) [Commensalibacter communis]CAI3929740.1 Predicted Na+-dependent transporter YfeH (YfeH) (PDB:4N7X) (PUBMED:21175741) [Commensalibacter communis]